MIRSLLAPGATLMLSACGTISANLPLPVAPSEGPNGQHSGVYAYRENAAGNITDQLWYPQNRAAYNSLIGTFGKTFNPALTPDFHLTQIYPTSGWILAASPKGTKVISDVPATGFWDADYLAITDYIEMLDDKAKQGSQISDHVLYVTTSDDAPPVYWYGLPLETNKP